MKEAKGSESCLNLVIEDFYNREGTARVFENVAPALRAGREGLKVVCIAQN